jgi:hypothetical protein
VVSTGRESLDVDASKAGKVGELFPRLCVAESELAVFVETTSVQVSLGGLYDGVIAAGRNSRDPHSVKISNDGGLLLIVSTSESELALVSESKGVDLATSSKHKRVLASSTDVNDFCRLRGIT